MIDPAVPNMARTRPIPRKRPAPPQEEEEPKWYRAKRPRQDDNTHFPFLELPRELRDEVYRHIVEADSSATTLRNQSLATKCGLVGVNNQVCEEFLDAVLFYAPVIKTTVRNHNFAHVVTFLNRLSEAQFKKFEKSSEELAVKEKARREEVSRFRNQRYRSWHSWVHGTQQPPQDAKKDVSSPSEPKKRIIRITLTYSHTKTSTKAQLNRWLDRFDDPNRRGAEVDFEYVLDRETWGKGGYKQRPRGRVMSGERSSIETRKIMEVGEKARYGWYGY